MSKTREKRWHSRASRICRRRGQCRERASRFRPLRFEWLEDRALLALTVLSTNATISESNHLFDSHDLVIQGATVAIDGLHNFNSVSLVSGAVLTHSPLTSSTAHALNLNVTGQISVDATSRIDVSGKGYLPGRTTGNTTLGGATRFSGGSHGGLGLAGDQGNTTNVYGNYAEPNDWGSGSGPGNGNDGVPGGGLVKLVAAELVLNGMVSADGFGAISNSGAGGAISITVERLQGVGRMSASGGGVITGPGGGGRIAVYAADFGNFNLSSIIAWGGTGRDDWPDGGPGTVYLRDIDEPTGTLIIDAGSGGDGWTPLNVPGQSTTLSDHVLIRGARTHVYASGFAWSQLQVSGGTLQMSGHQEAAELSLINGGVLTHPGPSTSQANKLDLLVTGTAYLDPSSRIDVTGKGFPAWHTMLGTTVGAATGHSGGSYGGLGGASQGSVNPAYGDFSNPQEFGSGGTDRDSAGGGLIRLQAQTLRLDGAIIANGAASGSSGRVGMGGGGSGGGIFVDVGTLTGTGSIRANGGNGGFFFYDPNGSGGGGGGGRIAVLANDFSGFSIGNVSAPGGQGGRAPNGGPGTIYQRNKNEAAGTLIVDSKGVMRGATTPLLVTADQASKVSSLVVRGSGADADLNQQLGGQYQQTVLATDGAFLTIRPTTLAGPTTITNGATVSASSTTWAGVTVQGATLSIGGFNQMANLSLVSGSVLTQAGPWGTPSTDVVNLRVVGDISIDATSRIDVTGKGYVAGFDGGNSTSGPATGLSGGSHGGLGGGSNLGSSNSTYGDYSDPEKPGSGGAGSGTPGGGVVRLEAQTLLLNGQIIADGGSAPFRTTGGAGGSVFFNVATLQGSGSIRAAGGPGYCSCTGGDGVGGGGGGRIALYARDYSGFVLSRITAPGGTGARAAGGQAGTIYIVQGVPHTHVRSRTPTGINNGYVDRTIDSVILQFNKPIDLDSFSLADFVITGQMGPVPVVAFTLVGDRTYRIDPAVPLTENGRYHFTLPPTLRDTEGFPLDQNANGILGEPADIYAWIYTVDTVAPRISQHTPSGDIAGTITTVDVWLSERIDKSTFTTADATVLRPNGTTVAVTGIQEVGLNRFRISFPSQTLVGTYVLRIGPDIRDLAGNRLDQDRDGSFGEAGDDIYHARFNLVAVDLGLSDLVLGSDVLVAGEPVAISWNGVNRTGLPLQGDWIDAVYLSVDDRWDINDTLLTTVPHRGGLEAGQTYAASAQVVVPGRLPGSYRVLVRADVANQERETNEADNLIATGPLPLIVRELAADSVAVNGTFTPTDRADYYAISVPADKNLLLRLASQSAAAANEIYVRFGAIPTRTDFDFAFTDSSAPDQRIVFPTSADGTYYILVFGSGFSGGPNTFTLSGALVGFSVFDTGYGRGGNAGNLTVEINGAKFDRTVVATLTDGAGINRPASEMFHVSQIKTFATFYLRGLQPGVYDVLVQNGAGASITVADGLTVVSGGGGNIWAQVDVPDRVARNRDFRFSVTWGNDGLNDAFAPLLLVGNTVPFGLLPGDLSLGTSYTFLGIQDGPGPPGIIRPGQIESTAFYSSSDNQAGTYTTYVDRVFKDPGAPFDWESLREPLTPLGMTADEFQPLFDELIGQIGLTTDDYLRMLSRNAALLPRELGSNSDVRALLGLQLKKARAAIGTSISGTLFATDLAVPTANRSISATNMASLEAFNTVTLNDGSFVFDSLPPGIYKFDVQSALLIHQNLETVEVGLGTAFTGLVITIASGAVIGGQVTSAASNQPVSGAFVGIFSGDDLVSIGTTDSHGRYQISGLPPASYTLQIQAFGLATTWLTDLAVIDLPIVVNAALAPESVLTGLVVGPDGQPLAEVLVVAQLRGGLPQSTFFAEAPNGAFQIGGLSDGLYDITLIPMTAETKHLQVVQLQPGQHLDLGAIDPPEDSNPDFLAWLDRIEDESKKLIYFAIDFLMLGQEGRSETRQLYEQYFNSTGANRTRIPFLDGSPLANAFKSHPVTREAVGQVEFNALVAASRLIREEFPDGLPSDHGEITRSYSFRELQLGSDYAWSYPPRPNPPGALAGGMSGGGPPPNPPDGAEALPDQREINKDRDKKAVTITIPAGSDKANVSFAFDIVIKDTVDFAPGGTADDWSWAGLTGNPFKRAATLERHRRAWDVPFVVSFRISGEHFFFVRLFQCPLPPGVVDDGKCIERPGSVDPNDKLGPAGYGAASFNRTEPSLSYIVRFENQPSATGPAQQIVVTDILDNDLDLNAFQLTEIVFANRSIPVPPGLNHYETRVPMTANGTDILVDVLATLDRDTRELKLSLQAVDPATGWLPEDPLVGLLYPNDPTGRGEGSISYVIRPKVGLPSGTVIENRARIVFDYNDPIDTPLVFNTLDADAPSSSVTPLMATTEETTFEVNWSGEDDVNGSGISSYDVYVSDNGGNYTLWLSNIAATSAAFLGQRGRTYAFYSIARDNVGHVELAPGAPDATITILSPLAVEAGPDETVVEGDLVGVPAASFTYNADLNLLSGTVDWGDGVTEPVQIVPGTGGGTFANTHSYADNGTFTVLITLSDGSMPVQDSLIVVVSNAPPTSVPPGEQQADEGAQFELIVAFTDAGVADTHLAAIDWGDGSPLEPATIVPTPSGKQLLGSHTYSDNGDHQITVTVTDDDNGQATASFPIHVANVAPTATLTNGGEVDEGSTGIVIFSNEFDPSSADTLAGFRYSYDFDNDGTFEIAGSSSPTATVPVSFLADGPRARTVRGRIQDKDGGFREYETVIGINNVDPVVDVGNDATIAEAGTFVGEGSFLDPGADTWTGTVEYGDGSIALPLTLNPNKTFSLSHFYADNGSYVVTVCVTDDDFATNCDALTVTVSNVAPTVTLEGPTIANEGAANSYSYTVSDPGADSFTLTTSSCGTNGTKSNVTFNSTTGAGSFDCTYSDDSAGSIVSVTVMDDDGGSGSDSRIVIVSNVAPAIGVITGPASKSGAVAETLTYSVPFSDSGSGDSHSCSINWGDGKTSSGTVTEVSGTGTCTASHVYVGDSFSMTPYTITFTVTDDNGGSVSARDSVTIHRSILVLDHNLCGALTMSGNANIDVNGNVVVFSSCPGTAIAASGNAHLEATKILVRGGVQTSGNAKFNPSPIINVPNDINNPYNSYFSDPLAGLNAPPLSTSVSSVNCSGNSQQTLDPGRYTQIRSSGNCVLTLKPGVYVVESGGFQVSGNASVSGQGVFLYNVSGSIHFSGNGIVNLTAPTAGDYGGVLAFQASSNTKPLSFTGNANGMRGTVYAPAAQASVSGNGALKVSLLANTVRLSGNASSSMTAGATSNDTDAIAIMGAGQLKTGLLSVSIQDQSLNADPELLARIRDAIQTLNTTFGPYGMTMVEMDAASTDVADIRIVVDSTSPCGDQAQDVLGCATASGEITILQGWNWYTGADQAAIGKQQFDYQTVITHELGHAVGVEHSSDLNSTMFSHISNGVARRGFTAQDLASLAHTDGHDDLDHDSVVSVLRFVSGQSSGLPYTSSHYDHDHNHNRDHDHVGRPRQLERSYFSPMLPGGWAETVGIATAAPIVLNSPSNRYRDQQYDQLDFVFANSSFDSLRAAQPLGNRELPVPTRDSANTNVRLIESSRSSIINHPISGDISEYVLVGGEGEDLFIGSGGSDLLVGGIGNGNHALDDALLEVVAGWH